ncbi:Oxysterol-binding protein 3 [Malassezia brasiliensis]|uniref:Oxysterol-binding protein 3 n=1 Tax=Malassezia brasiliensis TaxID=1821822 RepID=A0AAF0DRJ1_9BASI|nr:Oxysterol-binding protein 3 [Malassezia brasiliensis]
MESSNAPVLYSGWVLKKKKKKIQGYAKRWLVLLQDGTLFYSIHPNKSARGIIDVPHASVSSDIRHDLKMLSDADFVKWRNMLRKFLHSNPSEISTPTEIRPTSQLIDKADGLLQSCMISLQNLSVGDSNPEIRKVLENMEELRKKHGEIRAASSRRASGEFGISRMGTPVGHSLSSTSPSMSPLVEAPLGGVTASSASSFSAADDGDFYDAYDDFEGVEYQIEEEPGHAADVGDDSEDDGEESSDPEESVQSSLIEESNSIGAHAQTVTYRKELPAPVSGEEVSLFSMLKKNVGKDLSTISFPVTFNCPLSLLQAVAEEYEYAPELLERAAQSDDAVERLSLVGAFAVSGYASTIQRSSRKPFNPLLGETYECVRADRNLFFVAEKVVHRPPIVAAYAQGKGWKASSSGTVKNKFWGKSLELIAEGSEVIELNTGDVYSITKPSSFMRNLLAGNKYLEHVGEMTVTEIKSNLRLVIQFKESSMFGGASSRNHVVGTMYDANGSEIASFKGKWDEQFARQVDKDHLQVLWEAAPMPPNSARYYGFTNFAMSLNEITPDLQNILPPTDSRLRPDQRALEDGDVDSAENLKAQLEGRQRERRKELEEAGRTYTPQWFHLNPKKGEHEPEYIYGGVTNDSDYFQKRKAVAHGRAQWEVQGAAIFQDK